MKKIGTENPASRISKRLCAALWESDQKKCAASVSVSADGKSRLSAILDEIRTKKWGTKIFGTAWHFKHAKQKNEGLYSFGHQWGIRGLLIETSARWIFFPL